MVRSILKRSNEHLLESLALRLRPTRPIGRGLADELQRELIWGRDIARLGRVADRLPFKSRAAFGTVAEMLAMVAGRFRRVNVCRWELRPVAAAFAGRLQNRNKKHDHSKDNE